MSAEPAEPRSYLPIYDLLREYVSRVAGRDRSWISKAACLGTLHPGFTAGEDEVWTTDNHKTVTGHAAQKAVVEGWCTNCAVQWECARWGIEVDEEVGVYGFTARDRRWLVNRNPSGALGIIDQARVDGVPVAVAVRQYLRPPKRQV